MTGYDKHLKFRQRIRADSKGKIRPHVLSLDWNTTPISVRADVSEIIAVAIATQIRVVGLSGIGSWDMMLKKEYSQGGIKCIKWNSVRANILALGRVDAGRVLIDFLELHNGKLEGERTCEVFCDNGNLSSISWNDSGTQLLVTIDPDGEEKGVMVIVKYSTTVEFEKKLAQVDYSDQFSATFKPGTEFIFSTSPTSRSMHVWVEHNVQWKIFTSAKYVAKGVTKICFNPEGTELAAIGESLWIWNCKKLQTDKFSLRAVNVEKFDGEPRRQGAGLNLDEHCARLVSLDFSINDTLVTGSDGGSICIHEVQSTSKRMKKDYKACCFKWQNVQQYHPEGEITCVANKPNVEWPALQMIASGGTDGIISIWTVTMSPMRSERDEWFDRNCYYPEWNEKDYYEYDGYDVISILSDPSDLQEKPVSRQEEADTSAEIEPATLEEDVQHEAPSVDTMLKQFRIAYEKQAHDVESLGGEIESTDQKIQIIAAEVKTIQQKVKTVQESMKSQIDFLDTIVQCMSE